MKCEEKVSITINVDKQTFDLINQAVNFRNHENFLEPSNNLPTDYDIEDFICGSINYQLDMIRNYKEQVDYEELGKQGKLKNRFKEFLDKAGIKQKDLSDITGIHKANISTFLSNQKQPSLENFMRIWIAFKCPPIHELIYKEDE